MVDYIHDLTPPVKPQKKILSEMFSVSAEEVLDAILDVVRSKAEKSKIVFVGTGYKKLITKLFLILKYCRRVVR